MFLPETPLLSLNVLVGCPSNRNNGNLGKFCKIDCSLSLAESFRFISSGLVALEILHILQMQSGLHDFGRIIVFFLTNRDFADYVTARRQDGNRNRIKLRMKFVMALENYF